MVYQMLNAEGYLRFIDFKMYVNVTEEGINCGNVNVKTSICLKHCLC